MADTEGCGMRDGLLRRLKTDQEGKGAVLYLSRATMQALEATGTELPVLMQSGRGAVARYYQRGRGRPHRAKAVCGWSTPNLLH